MLKEIWLKIGGMKVENKTKDSKLNHDLLMISGRRDLKRIEEWFEMNWVEKFEKNWEKFCTLKNERVRN